MRPLNVVGVEGNAALTQVRYRDALEVSAAASTISEIRRLFARTNELLLVRGAHYKLLLLFVDADIVHLGWVEEVPNAELHHVAGVLSDENGLCSQQ